MTVKQKKNNGDGGTEKNDGDGDGDYFFSRGDGYGDGDKIDRFYGCRNRPRWRVTVSPCFLGEH